MIERVRAYSSNVDAPNGEKLANSSDPNQPLDLVFEGGFNDGMKPNLVTSHVRDQPGKHALCIDIDLEAELLPSRTPGHYHLYLDHKMDWEPYVKLLEALTEAGIVELGYTEASKRKGCTCLRIPKREIEYNRIKQELQAELNNGAGEYDVDKLDNTWLL